MDANHLSRVGETQARRHPGAPVTTLGGVAPIAQPLGHQTGPEVGDPGNVEAPLRRAVREAIAWHGRNHHVKGVGGVAAMASRVGEQRDDLRDFEDGTGPAMGDEQGQRIGSLATLVDQMNPEPINGGAEVGEAVQCCLLGAPVKLVAPVVNQLLDIGQIRAIVPRCSWNVIGPAGASKALAEICQHLVRNVDGERLHIHRDVLLCAWR